MKKRKIKVYIIEYKKEVNGKKMKGSTLLKSKTSKEAREDFHDMIGGTIISIKRKDLLEEVRN